jgi:hypothetical protein
MHPRRFASLLGIITLAGIGVLAPQAAVAAPPSVASVSGGGQTTAGGYGVSVSKATLKRNGKASGTFTSSALPGSPTVKVDQLVPPSQATGFFCLSGEVAGGGRANFYVGDIGDGTTTFDQWQLAAGATVTCDSNPDPGPNVLTLDSGDFQTSIAR